MHGLRTAGFTLLELMVVLVVIGIMLGFAVAALRGPDDKDRMQQEALRLRALMNLASEEAVVRSRTYGVRLTEGGYEFVVHSPDGWHPLQEKPLQRRVLPQGIAWARGTHPKGAALTPQVMLFADGTFTPFTLELRSQAMDIGQRLQGTDSGELLLQSP